MKLNVEQTTELKRMLNDESVPESEKVRARQSLAASAELEAKEVAVVPAPAPQASKPLSTQAPPKDGPPKYKWVNGARVRVKE